MKIAVVPFVFLSSVVSLVFPGCARTDASSSGTEAAAVNSAGAVAKDIAPEPVDNVRRAIRADRVIGADAAAITVDVNEGTLVLRGTVSSETVKERAGSVAESVGNMRSDNQLAIDPAETTVDRITSERVRQALVDDKVTRADAEALRIFTRDGAVTLRGFVRTDAVKQSMVVVTRAVGSVTRVETQLVVDGEARSAQGPVESSMDHLISERVRQAIRGERTLAAEAASVLVVTQDGVVHLSGTVSSEAAKARIGVVANAAGSVKKVVNRIEVRGR